MELKIAESATTASLDSPDCVTNVGEPAARELLPSLNRLSPLVFNAILAVAWLFGVIVALCFRGPMLMAGFDGGFMRDISLRQFAWRVPLFSASIDWFQGLGDMFMPGNFRLLPSFVAASFVGDVGAMKVVLYTGLAAEVSIAVWLFARALCVSRPIALAAMLITCIVDFPFYGRGLVWSILSLAPQIGSFIACAFVMMAAFLWTGRLSPRANVLLAGVGLALATWMMLANVTGIILAGPLLLLCAVSGIIAAADRAERRFKIGLLLVAAILLTVGGPAVYVAGVVLDTAPSVFPLELVNDRATFQFASILFHWNVFGPVGPLLVMLAVAGAVVAMFDRSRPTLRVFAFTLVTYLVSRLTFAALTIMFDFWRGPSPLYFEFFVVPLYAIFAAYFCARIVGSISARTGWQPPTRVVELGIMASGVALAIAFAATSPVYDYYFHFPQRSNSMIGLLADESAMPPGSEFRGRTAVMTGRTIEQSISWPQIHNIGGGIWKGTGNDMRAAGLHQFDIPGLFQYGSTMTPAFYAFTSRLLARPGDGQMRNVSVLRRIDPRTLAMLGVRFVVTDAPYEGAATLRATLPYSGAPFADGSLYLYEITHPNLGDYSPTIVTRSADATAIINRLAAADFDPSREILADVPGGPHMLVPAQASRLTFDGVSLRIQAESAGQSLLLLPLEFSRCLKARASAGAPTLFRANLLETGVLFSGRLDAKLAIRTGAFYRPWCRLQDYFDARALRVGHVPLPHGVVGQQGH